MINRMLVVFCVLCTTFFSGLQAKKVGLLIVATGKYDEFVDPLIASARKHFCTNHEVTYFVFADGNRITDADDVVRIYQQRLGWPYDTMMRNLIYWDNRELFKEQDYLFALDADMRFVDSVGDEILGERVATLHPGYVETRGTYETNPRSLAYVSEDEGEYYFAGGFFGGTREEFLNITGETSRRVLADLGIGIVPVWHDESHWNRYCIDFKPTVILGPAYCYPDMWLPEWKFAWKETCSPKLLCLTKNHSEYRE